MAMVDLKLEMRQEQEERKEDELIWATLADFAQKETMWLQDGKERLALLYTCVRLIAFKKYELLYQIIENLAVLPPCSTSVKTGGLGESAARSSIEQAQERIRKRREKRNE